MYISNLKMYIFSLKIEFSSRREKVSPRWWGTFGLEGGKFWRGGGTIGREGRFGGVSRELQPKLVQQIFQRMVLFHHHLELFGAAVGTDFLFRGTDADGHGHFAVLQAGA